MANDKKNVEYVYLPNTDGWMATFSDLVTLLITFFVLLISMQSMDDKAFKESFGFFNDAMGPLEMTSQKAIQGLPSLVAPDNVKIFIDTSSLSRSLLNAMEQKQQVGGVQGKGMTDISVREDPRGLAIMINGDLLFEKGSDKLAPEAYGLLAAVVSVISDTDALLSVEGHTDNVGNPRFNWQLSMRRANNVLNYFIYNAGMSPTRFAIAGYGSNRPVETNETPDGRKRNRRVEIVLLRDRF